MQQSPWLPQPASHWQGWLESKLHALPVHDPAGCGDVVMASVVVAAAVVTVLVGATVAVVAIGVVVGAVTVVAAASAHTAT